MSELLTDDEKVEIIKKWWRDNGMAVIVGILIGLGAIFGWRAWVGHQDRVRENANLTFEELLVFLNREDEESAQSAEKAAKRLTKKYKRTPYAALTHLAIAQMRLDEDDPKGAIAALRTAAKQAPAPGLSQLAALRLARLLIAQQDFNSATKVIDRYDDGGAFSADFTALRGDIAAAKNRPDEARAAWQQALDNGASGLHLLELKLDNLSLAADS